MAKSSRRSRGSGQVTGGVSVSSCAPTGAFRARAFQLWLWRWRALPLILILLMLMLILGSYWCSYPGISDIPKHSADLLQDKFSHKPRTLSLAQVRQFTSKVDGVRLWETHLRPMLIERVPGTAGSKAVLQHIVSQLRSLSAGWAVEEDSFQSSTPKGPVTFTNVLAVLNPSAPRRLLLACHHDSKILPRDPKAPQRGFIGASDSAVPCAMLLELVSALDTQLTALKQQRSAVTLQLVFFDGEEAFEEWTDTDSLYGSRHLAELMAHTAHPSGSAHTTQLQAVRGGCTGKAYCPLIIQNKATSGRTFIWDQCRMTTFHSCFEMSFSMTYRPYIKLSAAGAGCNTAPPASRYHRKKCAGIQGPHCV
ncbi:glutaminyl-peptide cyclotransferase-like a isoform X3 [Neoarius graeffei]|uniref:glutaminyl-peptide cyclotransferase-like a isoform X3 n=1 Tax=Neoarius graeffei TaxID=443677 RepID=UPI00298CF6D2|nr:glutaminyl-peptide cyclotransferase-like a isoform X3 [Neoarius graeffei]